MAHISHKRFWGLSVACACASFLLFTSTSALWLLLVASALLILSGCCLLLANYPRLLRLVFGLLPQKYPLLQLSAQQSIGLSGKTKVACCAFFIAATSNIGMNLMVDSFRGATFSWLESRLAAKHYLYYSGNIDIQAMANKKGIHLTPRFERYVQYEGVEIQQFSYPTTQTFKQALVFYQANPSNKSWSQFEQGKGVFVNQQFAFYFNKGLNDSLTLPHPSTKQATDYYIQGIIYDYGNPSKQVLLSLEQFSEPSSQTSLYAIDADDKALESFKNTLEQAGIDSEKSLIKTEQLLAISMQAFDRTFVITDGLNIVTLLVAALSLACAIIVLMDDVRPQNMLIRSLGVSALKTQLLALFQYLLLCLVALLLATPFGILLSWVLIFEINYQAFQWTYPLVVEPTKIIHIYALSLVVVLVVIALPIVKAAKKPLIEDIRSLN